MSLEKRFAKGQVVTWKPVKSRHGFYGAPGATEPWPVRIISGPTGQDRYEVEVIGRRHVTKKSRNRCTVFGSSLFETGEHEQT